MQRLLAGPLAKVHLDAVLSPYDGISRGIIASLKQVGYYSADKPGPVVTGQDAELPSVKSILAGEQTSTVFKDTRLLAAQVAKMAKVAGWLDLHGRHPGRLHGIPTQPEVSSSSLIVRKSPGTISHFKGTNQPREGGSGESLHGEPKTDRTLSRDRGAMQPTQQLRAPEPAF